MFFLLFRGFSFVYLAQDGSGNLYALKKIRCTLGTEEADLAQREVDIYRLFSHKNIIKLLVRFRVILSEYLFNLFIFYVGF